MEFLPYAAGSLLLVLLFGQLVPVWLARRARGRAPDLDGLLAPAQRGHRRLLVYFFSPRCGMCRTMTPVVEALAGARDDVLAVDVSRDAALARRLKVMGTPTLVVLEAGRIERMLLGARPEREIRALLD